MKLLYYARLPLIRRVDEQDRRSFYNMAWDPFELIELKQMSRKDLKGLMAFCDITLFNDIPIIACEDDEMRVAYIAWRSRHSRECRLAIAKKANKAASFFYEIKEGLIWWLRGM